MATLKEVEDGKIWAFLAMFLGIIGFIIVLLAKKDNKYALFYAKQSLVLFIVGFGGGVILSVLGMILGTIPKALLQSSGPTSLGLIGAAFWIFMLVMWVMGWISALSGQEKYLPLIGEYAKKINL